MSVSLFKKKSLTPIKRVCLRLKESREKQGMSLDELSRKTKIGRRYLQALEECRFTDLPTAEVYQKNFVRIYVEALGLNPEPFLQQYVAEERVKNKIKHPHKIIKYNWLSNLPNLLRYGVVLVLFLFLLFYLGIQVKRIVDPPQLSLYSPPEGFITQNNDLLVTGQTEREVKLYLNGKEIRNSEQGQFKEVIGLSPGVNTIVLTAEKKHGKITTLTRHVVLKENKLLSLLQTTKQNSNTP